MRRLLPTFALLAVTCAAPPPTPVAVPEPEAVVTVPVAVEEEKVIGSVRVTASALNVRAEASAEAEVVAQVEKGEALDVLRDGESWVKVRLASGEVGWVAARFVSKGGAERKTARKGCPADSDFAIVETPTLSFSDRGARGMVVVEANVNAKGAVTKTRVLSNSTGDEALAFLAEREIKAAKFSPPIRSCVARPFIYTYRRAF